VSRSTSCGDCVTDRCSCRAGNSEGIISVHGTLVHRVSPLYRLATDLSYVRQARRHFVALDRRTPDARS
jgi:hypothetical protein